MIVESFVSVVRALAAQRPQDVGFIFLDREGAEVRRLTYAELDVRARALAALLQRADLEGQRAVLAFPSGPEYVLALLGCLYAGVVAVPGYPPESGRAGAGVARLRAMADDARAAVVLTLASVTRDEAWAAAFADLPRLDLDAAENQLDPDVWQMPTLNGRTLSHLQYTSGSTSAPKGVMLDHDNLLACCAQSVRQLGATPDWRWLGWLPLFHDFGLVGGVLRPLFGGYQSVLMPPQAFLERPIRWLQAIARYRATISAAPNFAYELVLRKTTPAERVGLDLSSWRMAQNGAEAVRRETLERFTAAFAPFGLRAEALCPGYGLAEATLGVVTCTPDEPRRFAPGAPGKRDIVSCGRPYVGERLEIVDPEPCTVVPDGEVGEIWVAGPNVARGYWLRPEDTARVFGARLSDRPGPAFLRTGDLGFRRDGELFVCGRLKDLIVLRGRNIYPEDVEAAVEAAHPAIRAGGVAAFACERADLAEGLAVVAEINTYTDADLVLARVRAGVTRAQGVRPSAVALVEARGVPRTSSGKLQRFACRREYLAGGLPIVAEWREAPSLATHH